METRSLDRFIVQTPGTCGGRPRIDGRRIRVLDVARYSKKWKWSPKKIAAEFDLSLVQVFAALAFYYDHQTEMDKLDAEDEAFVEEQRKKKNLQFFAKN